MLYLSRIKEARKAKKLSQKGAGKVIGAHKERIGRIESGCGLINLPDLESLAAAYGYRVVMVKEEEYPKFEAFLSVFGGK